MARRTSSCSVNYWTGGRTLRITENTRKHFRAMAIRSFMIDVYSPVMNILIFWLGEKNYKESGYFYPDEESCTSQRGISRLGDSHSPRYLRVVPVSLFIIQKPKTAEQVGYSVQGTGVWH